LTRIIGIASAKGGVGKTTVASNLGIALYTEFNIDTILVDANFTASHLGLHLGMYYFPTTFNTVLAGKAKMEESIYRHISGVRFVPASLNLEDLVEVDTRKIKRAIKRLKGKTDIVFIDCAAGLGKEALLMMKVCDELLIVANPELPSIMDAKKVSQVAEGIGCKVLGIVLNRVRHSPYELTPREIEEQTQLPILAIIPEDSLVQKSILYKMPAVMLDPDAALSIEFKKLAARIVGKEYKPKILRKSLIDDVSRSLKRIFIGGLTTFRRI